MQKIAEISKIDLSSKDESVAMAVTNMWNQFALCEITLLEQRQNVALITQYKNEVVPYMMLNLTKTDGIEEDDDNMQNTIFSTSVVTLENINKLIGPEIE
jgi:dihydroxyacid dehydratase/phosphogluconate dehydratase